MATVHVALNSNVSHRTEEYWTAPTGPQPWVQPTGPHDAYQIGAQVTYNGQTWENTDSAANVWTPGVFGWVVI